MSSTSPLSPKHLLFTLALLIQVRLGSAEDQRHSSPEIGTLAHDADLENLELERAGNRNTNCVNFQVGEFGSPSTIFYDPCGGEEILALQVYM
jgi:hypothetical protein